MAQVDQLRRRLSVSQCGAAKVSGQGSSSDTDPTKTVERAGLTSLFETSEVEKKKVVLVSSVTDYDLKKRSTFHEKDSDILAGSLPAEEGKEWVQSHGIGWCCRKGMKPESPNQDSFNVLIVEKEFALYSVYDGHGPCGHDVSNFVRETAVKLFIGSPDRTTDPKKAFEEAFTACQELLATGGAGIEASMSGTTCTMVYHDMARDRLTIAHVGDSRAVLGIKSKDSIKSKELTKDHKPNDPEERKRIESANPPGRVVFDGYYNHRVFAQEGMYPGLNMSRAIGDVVGHKEAGLSAFPDVKELDLSNLRQADGGLILLVCTDGVWEFMSNDEAVQEVHKFPASKAMDAMLKLVTEGYDRWMKDSDNEVSDDITGIYIDLSKKPTG